MSVGLEVTTYAILEMARAYIKLDDDFQIKLLSSVQADRVNLPNSGGSQHNPTRGAL